jgi:hypothetical protein
MTFRRVLETTIGDSSQKFWLQKEITETSSVNAGVRAPERIVKGKIRDAQLARFPYFFFSSTG